MSPPEKDCHFAKRVITEKNSRQHLSNLSISGLNLTKCETDVHHSKTNIGVIVNNSALVSKADEVVSYVVNPSHLPSQTIVSATIKPQVCVHSRIIYNFNADKGKCEGHQNRHCF